MFADEQLLSPDFDEGEYLRHTLQLPSFDAEQSRLARCIAAVDSELQAAIADNAADLVDSVGQLTSAAAVVDSTQHAVAAAQGSLARLRHVICEPYQQVEAGVAELRNSGAALDLIRAVYRFLAVVAKLQENVNDTARCARLLREADELLAEHDLVGIDAIDAAVPVVSRVSATVRSRALELLRHGMSRRSHSDLGLAVQCFASLGSLSRTVTDTVHERKREALTLIVKQLSPAALQQHQQPAGGGGGGDTLERIADALRSVAEHAAAVAELWRVLRRRDASTQRPFLELIGSSSAGGGSTTAGLGTSGDAASTALLQDFWKGVGEHLADHLVRLAKKGSLHAMLVAQYAAYHKVLAEFVAGLRGFFIVMLSPEGRETPTVATQTKAKGDAWLLAAAGDVQEQFKSSSRERHRERVTALTTRLNAAAPSGGAEKEPVDIVADPRGSSGAHHHGVPSAANTFDSGVKALLKVVQHDLTVNRTDDAALQITLEVTAASLTTVAKALRDALTKIPVGALPSVSVSVTTGQLYQISIANAASELVNEMQSALAQLPRGTALAGIDAGVGAATTAVRRGIAELEAVAGTVVQPFFDSAAVATARHIDDLFPVDGVLTASSSSGATDSAAMQQRGGPKPVAGGAAAAAPRGGQLHNRLWHFVTRFGMLFDRRLPGLEAAQRHLSDAIVRQFLANVLVCQARDAAARATIAAELEAVCGALSGLYAVERLDRIGRAMRHAIRLYDGRDDDADAVPATAEAARAAAQRGHPAALLLSLLGRLDPADVAEDIAAAARTNRSEIRRVLVAAFGSGTVKGCGFLWEAVAYRALAKIDTDAVDRQPSSSAVESGSGADPDVDKSQQEASRLSDDAAQAAPSSQKKPPVSQGPARLTLAARVKRACLALQPDLVPPE